MITTARHRLPDTEQDTNALGWLLLRDELETAWLYFETDELLGKLDHPDTLDEHQDKIDNLHKIGERLHPRRFARWCAATYI
jgi:hypothetical protein